MEIDFRPWFVSHGGIIHPDVEIASGPAGNNLSLRIGCSLSPGTMIASCPHKLTISWLNVIHGHTPFINQFRLSPVKDGSTVITKTVVVRFFLVEQYLLGEQSFWWPYIRFLPQPFKKDELNSLLWYDNDDLLWLRGTNLEDARRSLEQDRRREYDEGIEALSDALVDLKKAWSWDLYKWAAGIMDARCFPGAALANNKLVRGLSDDPTNGAPPAVDHDSPVLIPGVDLANHRPSANVTWLYNPEDCCLVIDEPYKGGQQIWNNYGPKPNEHLIMGYGFSLFRNPMDRCYLAVSSGISRKELNKNRSPMGQRVSTSDWDSAVSAIPDLTEQIRNEGMQWLRLSDQTEDNGESDSQPSYEFSPHFLEGLSGALYNERELFEPDKSLWSKVNFFDNILTRNKLNVMCVVVMKLQRQTAAITTYEIDLPQWPMNDRQFHAARYRRSQLRILRTVTDALLSSLRTSAGLKSHGASGVQIVRLEHILLESPKEFLIPFRACLNAGLGTRKAAKIREKQWVECAFSLWMCGLWLLDPCGLERRDTPSGSGFQARISQWFCWVRKIYGDSPETENLVTVHRKRVLDSSRVPTQGYGSSGSDVENIDNNIVGPDVDSTDFLAAESYLRVAEAAVKKDNKSLYSHPEVTAIRLWWCMNIIRQEGFMCPNLEGETGEEHDEFVLFLEVGRE